MLSMRATAQVSQYPTAIPGAPPVSWLDPLKRLG